MHFSTIRIIAVQEWQLIFRNRTALVLFGVLAAILLTATGIGWQQQRQYQQQRSKYQTEVQHQWMNQPDRHPHRVAHYGYLVFRERSPLSFFDPGLSSFAGNALFLEAHRQNTVNMSEAGFSNGMLRFGELNIAMVLQLLVPLFIFFIGFGTVAALRENQVLKLLISQGVTFAELLTGKTLGIVAVTLVLFGPVILVTMGSWLLLYQGAVGPDTWLRMLLLFFVYAAYFITCAWITVLISTVSRSARAALLTLLVCWITFFIIVPKAAQTAGANLYPAPDKIAFEHTLEAALEKEGDSHNPDDPHFAAFRNAVLQQYHVKDVKELPFNYSGYLMAEGERISASIFNVAYNDLIHTYQRQNNVAGILSFIDPYLAVRISSMSLSAADMHHYVDFQQEAEQYRYNMVQGLNDIHAHQIDARQNSTQRVSNKNWQRQAAFSYQPKTTGWSIRRQWLPLVACAWWLLAGILLINIVSKRSHV